tara:strand:- start:1239 stop:1682 length:444 start_codon:yes stop_codon:yes gene_type:complete
MSKIKSFRGMLANETQARIHVSGGKDDIGYRIHKFQIMANQSMSDYEITAKIYANKQAEPLVHANQVDFNQDNLLAAAFSGLAAGEYAGAKVVIFDREVFNQDIFVQCQDNGGSSQSVNYYIELEEVKMSNPEAAVVNYKAALLHGE